MSDGPYVLPEVTIVGQVPKTFGSMDAAAIEALHNILPTSLSQSLEYSGAIFQTSGGRFFTSDPEVGESDSSTTDFTDIASVVSSGGGSWVGIYHTHPKVNNNYINFSGQDMTFVIGHKLVLYMGTDNLVKKLIPKSLLPQSEQNDYPFGFKQITLRTHAY